MPGNNRGDLIARIEAIASYRDRIALTRRDAAVLLRTLLPSLPTRTLTYLDPPYYVMGQKRLYANFYKAADHAKLAKIVSDFHRPWIVSYDNAPEIRSLYSGYRSLAYGLNYTATDRYRGSEIMFFSDDLVVPDLPDPASVTPRCIAELRTPRKQSGRRIQRAQ